MSKSICFVTTISSTLKAFILPQTECLLRDGWKVTWICSEDSNLEKDIPNGVIYFPIPFKRGMHPLRLPGLIIRLFCLFMRERFDIVQYATANAILCSSTAAWFARIPIRIKSQWGIRFVYHTGLIRYLFKLYDRWSSYCSTVIQPDSKSNLEFSIKEGLYPKNKGIVIWNGSACGVNLQKFDYKQINEWRMDYRKKIGFDAKHLVIGFVGSIRREKGCNELLAACQSFFYEMPEARLLLIGDKYYYHTVDRELREWAETSPQVKYISPNTNIPQYMACMDIFSLPSYQEGFGMAVIEAEAMGVPVVVADYISAKDAMRHEETGLVVPIKNTCALAEALKILLNDAEKRLVYGVAASEFVRNNFDQKEFLKRVLDNKNQLFQSYYSNRQ